MLSRNVGNSVPAGIPYTFIEAVSLPRSTMPGMRSTPNFAASSRSSSKMCTRRLIRSLRAASSRSICPVGLHVAHGSRPGTTMSSSFCVK